MPELPEVETTRRGLAPAMAGRIIRAVELRRPDLRFPFQNDFRDRLEGRRVETVGRRAKYLVLRLDGGDALVAHLGMSGSFRIEGGADAGAPVRLHHEVARLAAHDHVLFPATGPVILASNHRSYFDGAALARVFAGVSANLKSALLDQKRIAGLGNIYVCEALHRAGLSPARSAATIAGDDRPARAAAKRLADAIRRVLEDAIKAGGSSLRDFSGTDGKPGYFQHSFRAYDREGAACPRKGCGGEIARTVHAGRSTFFCATCQT